MAKPTATSTEPTLYDKFITAKAHLAKVQRDRMSMENNLDEQKTREADAKREVESLAKQLQEEASASLR